MKGVKSSAVCILFCLFLGFSAFSSSAQESQSGWRWCSKCQGLFFGGNAGSSCPSGNEHDGAASGDYTILFTSSKLPGQENWRWCSKCQGLFFSMQGKPSVCPKGGVHDSSGSGNYKMLEKTVPGQKLQGDWKWCKKCGVAFFSKNSGSKCPVGGSHDGSASSGYFLIEGSAKANQVIAADNVRQFPFSGGEIQSTVVAPGKKNSQCPKGRILISSDILHPPTQNVGAGPVIGRNLDDASDTVIQSTFDPVPDGMNYEFGTNDHDLMSLKNGDVYYITGAFSKVAPTKKPAWWNASYRGAFGPGARTVVLTWRSTNCGETFHYVKALEFDPLTAGDGSCAMPQRPRIAWHNSDGSGNYRVPFSGFAGSGQEGWRYCWKCKQLFFEASEHNVCPSGGAHDGGSSGAYKMLLSKPVNFDTQEDWKWCKNCGALFYSKNATSSCPAQLGHDSSESGGYYLLTGNTSVANASVLQPGWRWCSKCRSLFFGANAFSVCPSGGSHDDQGSGKYLVAFSSFNQPGQEGWRWCNKCQQLFFSKQGKPSVCPTGGAHNSTGSGEFKMLETQPTSEFQKGWQWCKYCGAAFFSESQDKDKDSTCPARRGHDGSGSGNYHLIVNGPNNSNLQPDWHWCNKCQSLFFGDHKGTNCAAGPKGSEIPLYDMGGSDGQLVTVDRSSDNFYLTFQCVGLLQDKAKTVPFELSNRNVNKTFVASSAKGAAWSSISSLDKVMDWRFGIVELPFGQIGLGYAKNIIFGQKTAAGAYKFNSMGFEMVSEALGWNGFNQVKTKPPANLIHANDPGYANTLIIRPPGTSNVVLLIPATIQGKGYGYRIFFYDRVSKTVTEAADPIVPATKQSKDFVFHLTAADPGNGPVLLYWYDLDSLNKSFTIRGRLITGDRQYTSDFTISKANGLERSFNLKPSDVNAANYWYGDYHTADGFLITSTPPSYAYYPIWVEPDQTFRYTRVEYKVLPNGISNVSIIDMPKGIQ